MSELYSNLERSRPISIDEIHRMLGKGRWATIADYLSANNSDRLEVFFGDDGLYYVIHKGIEGEGREIIVPTTPRQIKDYGKINLAGFPNIDFATALLWQFHGAPCERESRRRGGEIYPRR